MPTIHILIGPPGSGKSTWRKQFENTSTIISTDDMIEEYARKNKSTYSQAFHNFDFKNAELIMKEKIKSATENQLDIIVDRTNMTRKSYMKFLNAVPQNYQKIAVVFRYDPIKLRSRLDHRAKLTGKIIPPYIVEGMIEIFKEPSLADFDLITEQNSFV